MAAALFIATGVVIVTGGAALLVHSVSELVKEMRRG